MTFPDSRLLGSRPARHALLGFALFFLAATAAAASPARIKPDLNAVSYPSIKVINLIPDGLGAVTSSESASEEGQTLSTKQVWLTAGTQVQLVVSASDPIGGIAELNIEPLSGTPRSYNIISSDQIGPDGLAPSLLSVFGQTLVRVSHSRFKAPALPGKRPIRFQPIYPLTVKIIAKNFQGRSSTLYVVYSPLVPVRARLEAPATINRGQTALLYQDWAGATDVTITPTVPLSPGGTNVSPLSDTTYTLVARQPFGGSTVGYPNPDGIGQTVHPTTATSSVTIKVIQPPPPPGAAITTAIFLESRPPFSGWHPYALTWPPTGFTGTKAHLLSLANPNPFGLRLVKAGHNSSECGDSDAVVELASGQSTSGDDNNALFYDPKPALAVSIVACILNGATNPPNVRVDLTYVND